MGIDTRTIKLGQYRVVKSVQTGREALILIEERHNNDLVRYIAGTCVLTGDRISHGLYTDEQLNNIGPALSEMEVIAWCSR